MALLPNIVAGFCVVCLTASTGSRVSGYDVNFTIERRWRKMRKVKNLKEQGHLQGVTSLPTLPKDKRTHGWESGPRRGGHTARTGSKHWRSVEEEVCTVQAQTAKLVTKRPEGSCHLHKRIKETQGQQREMGSQERWGHQDRWGHLDRWGCQEHPCPGEVCASLSTRGDTWPHGEQASRKEERGGPVLAARPSAPPQAREGIPEANTAEAGSLGRPWGTRGTQHQPHLQQQIRPWATTHLLRASWHTLA